MGIFLASSPLVSLFVFCLATMSLQAGLPESTTGFTQIKKQTLPAKQLRGYGQVTGEFGQYLVTDARRPVSILLITCEEASLAGLMLGKYRSDLYCLGGVAEVNLAIGGKTVPVHRVEGQGSIAAARQAAQVTIVAAQQDDDLLLALNTLGLDKQSDLDFKGGAVPMYLDRFDKYGWHFYFNPWSTPKNEPNYDLDSSFQYLAKNRLGMMIPLSLNNIHAAEGVINYGNLAWAIERGRQLSIPTIIQAWAIGAPRMLLNRLPYETVLNMPQFVGNLYGPGENGGGYPVEVAWSSQQAEDMLLGWLQPICRKYAKYANVTGFAEPHGEIEHGTPMVFTEYGPVADAAFRRFLKEKYPTPQVVDQRWASDRGMIRSWEDVRVPEVASFLGWNEDAIDVGGKWRMAYDRNLLPDQQTRWAEPLLDDKSWPEIIAPGDDRPRFRNQEKELRVPAVFRRHFTLTDAEHNRLLQKGQGKCYLYVWALSRSRGPMQAALNGKQVGPDAKPVPGPAWWAFEVSSVLRAGDNLLALHLPWSELSYRVYLSPTAPRCYPDLGREMNARWVDFRDFVVWTRYDQVRRGMETIRREDPHRSILLMSPNGMIDHSKALAEDYGGVFHNTGYMAAWWNDYLPALMRSSGLPFTVEAGNGAPDLATLKRFLGHWFTEGVNGINYFQNLGEILWDPEQKAWFEAHQPLVHLMGKYHSPPAQVAVMYSGRGDRLSGFPWDAFPGDRHGLLADSWARMQTENEIPMLRDILLDTDFARGRADKYPVIIAAGTVIMEEALVDRIEQWVSRGRIFVAYGQMGRHTPEVKEAWPLAKLSGYRVVPSERRGHIAAATGQTVFTGNGWAKQIEMTGLALDTVAADCQTLLAWQDGKPFVGMRKVGKGTIITFAQPRRGLLDDVLRGIGTYHEKLKASQCFPVQYLSNNGLFSVFVLWANQVTSPTSSALFIPGQNGPRNLRDVNTGKTLTGNSSQEGVTFNGIALEKDDIHAFLAARGEITQAPLDWFQLQRDWWQGTVKPRPAPTVPPVKNSLPLDEDWAFSPVTGAAEALAFSAPGVNDKDWKRIDLGIWNVQGFPIARHGVFRKEINIPAGWNDGRIWVWAAGSGDTLRPPYKVKFYIDGRLQWTSGNSRYSMMSLDLTENLTPGKHLLAWDMEGTGKFDGMVGDMWLEYVPRPVFTQSLAGKWNPGITLPGNARLIGARRTFVPDPRGKDYLATLYSDGKRCEIQSVFINNTHVYFYGGPRGHHQRMTLNPWLKWGENNDIELVPHYNDPMDIATVELRFYRADQW